MGKYDGMPDDVKAFMMDADRLQRMHDREITPKTPEDIERTRIFNEKNKDVQLVIAGKMTTEDLIAKWGE